MQDDEDGDEKEDEEEVLNALVPCGTGALRRKLRWNITPSPVCSRPLCSSMQSATVCSFSSLLAWEEEIGMFSRER